jgi:hypothetical protein
MKSFLVIYTTRKNGPACKVVLNARTEEIAIDMAEDFAYDIISIEEIA